MELDNIEDYQKFTIIISSCVPLGIILLMLLVIFLGILIYR
jgi:hypothetical protein